MTDDLAVQIRTLCDTAEPVTAAEAILRARRPEQAVAGRRTTRLVAAIGAGLAIAACAMLAWSLSSSHGANHHTLAAPRPRIILTAARLRRIATRSSAAAASGTAQVTELTTQPGAPQSSQSVAVTFDGANIDEKIASNSGPPGSASSFTTDDRLVDGQFYIYTAGPKGVVEWLHDTNGADDVASMQFPDPRTLYAALGSAGDFEVLGTTTSDGTTLTHLRALDPSALETAPFGNLAQGSLTSLELWIDPNDIVQQMTFSSSATLKGCRFGFSLSKLKRLSSKLGAHHVTLPALHAAAKAAGVQMNCGPQTTTSTVTVGFANLGAPESIPIPQGAVDFAGKG